MAAFRKSDTLLLFRLTVLLLTAVAVCDACCVPKTFYGAVRVLRSTVAPGMPDTSVQIYISAYDAVHKRVGIQSFYSNTPPFTRNLLDFGKGLQYVITGNDANPKCTQYPLKATWREACMPDNATKSEGFYMGHQEQQYYHPMNAVAFTYTQGSVKAKVMVTQDECALVGEVVYDTSNKAGTNVINRLYVNQSTYANDDFFKLPPKTTCVVNPTPPPMSQWEYIALFGWLIGLPGN
ncbi:uncharacterized protein [Littorina saxatilis]|uniref:Ependymin-related protein n=1 Tax=Littorina saxatilis TaxID=31220 RepID=A0AAN9AQJ6_9CAEN